MATTKESNQPDQHDSIISGSPRMNVDQWSVRYSTPLSDTAAIRLNGRLQRFGNVTVFVSFTDNRKEIRPWTEEQGKESRIVKVTYLRRDLLPLLAILKQGKGTQVQFNTSPTRDIFVEY